MIEPQYMPLVTWGASFVVALAGGIIGTTWRVAAAVGKHDQAISKQIANLGTVVTGLMNAHEQLDLQRFAAVNANIDQTSDTLRHEFGETGLALREQLHLMEVAGLKQDATNIEKFLQRNSFYKMTDEMSANIKGLVKKVDDMAIELAAIAGRPPRRRES